MKFKELLEQVNLHDTHLLHKEVEIETCTMSGEWNIKKFTDEGIKHYEKLLNAKVECIYQGIYGLEIILSGVGPKYIELFNYDQAGYCSESLYKKVFTEEENVKETYKESKTYS